VQRHAHLPVGRRAFIAGVAASVIASCSKDDPASSPAPTSAIPRRPRLAADPFRLGVASGDPLPDQVVLWTRLAPDPLAGGLAGMPDTPVEVEWQVAADPGFTSIVADGAATAEPGAAHSVHVDAAGLDPATDYHYRFRVDGFTSPVGQTRTAPASGGARLRLAVVTCQDFGSGYYAAYRHLLAERVDLVVHLGDYIYEWAFDTPERPILPPGVPATLDDYRLRHATYRLDPDLQAAHARFPFALMWDDHEVFNNYAGATVPDDSVDPESVRARRAAAYRAYWEHLPLRIDPPTGPDVRLYRDLRFGNLARLHLLDVRQYADEPPCRDGAGDDFGDCPARLDERAYLGPVQEAWLDGSLAQGGVVWNLVGSPTLVAGVDLGPPGRPGYYLETWDGYPAERARVIERLARPDVANPVVLSGDWHAGMVNDVHLVPGDVTTPVVAPELMTPPISSPLYEVARAQNPHVHHVVDRHGYLILQVEPSRLTATFRVLDDVRRPDSGISTDSSWPFAAKTPGAPAR
jgi:alkaline phosphatase D